MENVRNLIGLRRVEVVETAPCGTFAVAVVAVCDQDTQKYRRHLWRIDLAGESPPAQLTRGEHSATCPRFRDDGTLAFLSNRPIDKDADPEAPGASQIWAFPDSGGEPERLTDEPLGVTDFRCARRVDVIALWTTRVPGVPEDKWRQNAQDRAKKGPSALHYHGMPVRFWDHWRPAERPILVVIDASGRRVLTPDALDEYEHLSWDLDPRGAFVVATELRVGADRIFDVAVVELELATGARTVLLSQEAVSFGSLFLSPDGEVLLAGRWARNPGIYPACRPGVLHRASGDWTEFGQDWELEGTPAAWQDRGHVLLTAPDHGVCAVFRLTLASGAISRCTGPGAWSGVQGAGARLVGLRSDLLHPPEVHVVEADGRVHCPGPLAGENSLADDVCWSSHTSTGVDGQKVQWFQVAPKNAKGQLPGVIWVHGGPISSWQDAWHWRWNSALFATFGYVICLPNPRGSTGFGHGFVQGIWNNRWGAECYDDVMACVEDFAVSPGVDALRLGLMGGSFGGYMANQVGTTTDRFRCLVSHAGLFDFTAFYGATDFPAWWAGQLGSDPYSDRAAFERWSPSRGIAGWSTPTLVVHGEKDYRVPIGEALALFEALQLHGVESELLVFPDEGHWIQRPTNILAWHETILAFLGRFLQPG
jgi:dipeptidyl aminopeptidase/acylaminoacyl peptidase